MENTEMAKIEAILDAKIRPMLKADGGNLEVISLEGKTLKMRYQGACCGCPHAATGTLMAIEGVLKDEYDPDITVVPV
ncbi:MAG: NifU family protein [bacterium]|nr:NifU family protein [bacterium]MBU1917843.1 NifU family protein [bacterium]